MRSKPVNMTEAPISPTLIRMTLPVTMGLVAMVLYQLIDTYFISKISTEALAAVSFTFPVTFSLISISIGLGIGTSATIAKALGSGNIKAAKASGRDALILGFIVALITCQITLYFIKPILSAMGATDPLIEIATPFLGIWLNCAFLQICQMVANAILRARGQNGGTAAIMGIGAIINTLLDPIFIFGFGPIPAMGVQGAALATALVWLINMGLMMRLILRVHLITPKRPKIAVLKKSWLALAKISVPAAIANMMTPIAGGVLTAFIAKFGPEVVAAWGVGNRVEFFALLLILALSMTLSPFTSQNLGANHFDRIKKAQRLCFIFALIWQGLLWLVMVLLSNTIANIFSTDPLTIKVITLFLLIIPIGYGCQGIIILSASSLNAMHAPMKATLLSTIRLFGLTIPLAWLGGYLYELNGLLTGIVIANIIGAFIATQILRRTLKQMQKQV